MVTLKQISVFVENKPGSVRFPCRVLADAGVDLTTLALADSKDFGILRLITKDWEKALNVLKENRFAVSANDVIALQVENVPGGLARLLEILDQHGRNVEYMYASVTGVDGCAVLIFRFEHTEQAAEIIKNIPECRIVGPDQFFSLKKN